MSRITRILLLFIAFTGVERAGAQYFYSGHEYGFALGGAEYFGDINTNYGFKYVRPAGGAFIRFHINPFIGIRTSLNYARVGYDDKYATDPFQKRRNLNFKSD